MKRRDIYSYGKLGHDSLLFPQLATGFVNSILRISSKEVKNSNHFITSVVL